MIPAKALSTKATLPNSLTQAVEDYAAALKHAGRCDPKRESEPGLPRSFMFRAVLQSYSGRLLM